MFAFAVEILNNCSIIANSKETSQEVAPTASLADLKKATEHIFGYISIEEVKPKPKEPEKKVPESSKINVPYCPVFLEKLDGSRHCCS